LHPDGGPEVQIESHWLSQPTKHRQYASAAEHVVTVPSQLIDCPDTLVQVFAVQLKVEWAQFVVHIAANSGVGPRKKATEITIRSPAKVKSLRMETPFF
jgi:hypothetical protein